MTKEEVVSNILKLSDKLDEIEESLRDIIRELTRAQSLFDDLPTHVTDFEEDEKEEKE